VFLVERFFLPFSPDHERVIAKLERVVRRGGTFAVAMARGSGKTELLKAAALWAILYGYRKFTVIIGPTATHAARVMDDLKTTLAHNDRLAAAFPEACHCVRDLEGIVHRARVQLLDGKPSGLEWTANGVRLAWVGGAACSGAVIRAAGLTGAIRGMSATGPDGGTIRPDLVLIDDPSDREAAQSPTQTDNLERIVTGDVLGLSGPTNTIACLAAVTIIADDDLADRLLDRERNPQWQGERTRLVEAWPTDTELWDRYFDIRDNSLRAGGDGSEATEFYKAHRDQMDAGAVMSWPERFDPDRYASALEEAMCKRHESPAAFASEFQNQPLKELSPASAALDPGMLERKVTNLPRRTVPRECTRLTAGIDVGAHVLFYTVCAWDERYGGSVIEYGTFPDQNRPYFSKSDPRSR
jgi:hypothetical protein